MPSDGYIVVGWWGGEPERAMFTNLEFAVQFAADLDSDWKIYEATLVAFGPGTETIDYDGSDHDSSGEGE